MKVDVDKFRKLLKGTPMESLTDKQINNVIIGEYPLTLSSSHIKALWDNALSKESVEMEHLRWVYIDSLLESMTFNALKARDNKLYEAIEQTRKYAKKVWEHKGVISFQADIIRQQEKDLFKYELEIRKLKGVINF